MKPGNSGTTLSSARRSDSPSTSGEHETREPAPLGLFGSDAFRVVTGMPSTSDAQAVAWYFERETVAVPAPGTPVAGFASETRWIHDVRLWGASHPGRAPLEAPLLVWLGAADVLRHAAIDVDGTLRTSDGCRLDLALVDKLPLNRSWVDASSMAWFARGPLSLRGTLQGSTFTARVLWPEDHACGPLPAPRRLLAPDDHGGMGLIARMREATPADAPFRAETLWERTPAAPWNGKAVLGVLVSGAQGDDDEAHAGHFALVTGRIDAGGAIDHWMVDNFYSLDIESEKGILAAPVPLSGYLGDLNAGQSWYRPSWMLVAVLDDERAAVRVQSAMGRVFRQFWRHQLVYQHAIDNCTSISVDTLRALGLDVPTVGPTIGTRAALAFPWILGRERSIARARVAYEYLVAERTRLLPALALQAVADALLQLTQRTQRPAGRLATELNEDLSALAWLRFPQFPSSRAWGGPPVASLDEYRARVPRDPAQRKIVPVPVRPFPEALKDADLLPSLARPSDRVLRHWVLAPLALLAVALILFLR